MAASALTPATQMQLSSLICNSPHLTYMADQLHTATTIGLNFLRLSPALQSLLAAKRQDSVEPSVESFKPQTQLEGRRYSASRGGSQTQLDLLMRLNQIPMLLPPSQSYPLK